MLLIFCKIYLWYNGTVNIKIGPCDIIHFPVFRRYFIFVSSLVSEFKGTYFCLR